jgi:hypothetical protein
MLQSVKQSTEQPAEKKRHPGGNPAWVKGMPSPNPRGSEGRAKREARIAGVIETWCEPAGGVAVLTPAEYALLHRAAELFSLRPKSHEDTVRVLNLVTRLLTQCGLITKRGRNRDVKPPSLAEYLAGRGTAP